MCLPVRARWLGFTRNPSGGSPGKRRTSGINPSTLLSTNDVAPRERAPVWREWVFQHFGGLDSDLYGDTDFEGHGGLARRRGHPHQMAARGVRLGELLARPVGGASGISRVTLETMRSTYQELPHMSDTAARGAGELIMQLVRLSLLELAGHETAQTQREALRDATLAGYILQQRLQGCIRELRERAPAGRPITQIALSWGFPTSRTSAGCSASTAA